MEKRDWLISMRKNQKITTSQIAARTGISQSFYTKIELGKKTPSVNVAKRIAAVLFFPWTDFFRDAA